LINVTNIKKTHNQNLTRIFYPAIFLDIFSLIVMSALGPNFPVF